MTSPIVVQQPGFGEQIQQGLAPFLQALQFQQQQVQRQQQIDIQQQQVELQAMSQRSLERERIVNRGLEFVQMFGPDILEDPSLAAQLEEAGIKPAAILSRHKENQKKQQDAIQAQRDVLIGSFPKRLQPALKMSLGLLDQGAPAGQVSQSFNLLAAEAIDEETLLAINSEFPVLKDLPPEQRLEAFASLKLLQAQKQLGVGPGVQDELDRQLKEQRLELGRLNIQLQRERDPDLATAGRILQIIERSLDPLTIPSNLLGKPREEQVRELFGASGVTALKNAERKFLDAGQELTIPGRFPQQ